MPSRDYKKAKPGNTPELARTAATAGRRAAAKSVPKKSARKQYR